jgi:hypothetical protein
MLAPITELNIPAVPCSGTGSGRIPPINGGMQKHQVIPPRTHGPYQSVCALTSAGARPAKHRFRLDE